MGFTTRTFVALSIVVSGCGACEDEGEATFTPTPTATDEPTVDEGPLQSLPADEDAPEVAEPSVAAQSEMEYEGAPTPRMNHAAVFTGTHLVVWGGDEAFPDEADDYAPVPPRAVVTGGRYDLASNTWAPTTTRGAPPGAYAAEAVWTGREVVVWGGFRGQARPSAGGGRYDPSADRWRRMRARHAPSGRAGHTMLWTGTEALVWGGEGNDGPLGDGARYDPASDTWTTLPTDGAPSARTSHSAVWNGTEMIVWGGEGESGELADGARYDLSTDTWRPLATEGAPSVRREHVAVWTGESMIVWGGEVGSWEARDRELRLDGAVYTPLTDTWRAMTATGAFTRDDAQGVWTGTHLAVLGECSMGDGVPYPPPTLGLYAPDEDKWTHVSASATTERPLVLAAHELLAWGGTDGTNIMGEGVRISLTPRPTP